jgi:transposase, IS5 family
MQITLFPIDFHYSSKWYIFKELELGRIYDCINWDGLSELLPPKRTLRGSPPWLSSKGLFGLMFLKHYTGLSDEKLVDRFNTDWAMQMFCGVLLAENEIIRDNSFVSRIRSYLAKHVSLEQMQQQMLEKWKPNLTNSHVMLADATAYESHLRFPTDVKLLWECSLWLWSKTIPELCKRFNHKVPRSKFDQQKRNYLIYSKLRRKSRRKTSARKRSLLHLVDKGIQALQQLLNQTQGGKFSAADYARLRTIKQILLQQKQLYSHPGVKIKDRIVSLAKPYVRPIKRGKENKEVEFGMKVHMNQVDGLNVIEYASFNNFNECKRLKISVLKHKKRFGKCTHISADRIYPTNENRRFCTTRKIISNFDKKGPKKDDKQTKQIKGILNKARSSSMEGSFGNEKNHYLLRKIKARSKETEMIWLFFGVFTANAVKMAKKVIIEKSPPKRRAA